MDVPSPHTYLASERPDLVERCITTEDKYYAKHQDKTKDKLRSGPLHQEMVCDRFGSFAHIPARPYQVTEFLARHVFEHLSIAEAKQALLQIRGVMEPGGMLRLDVPDHEATLRAYRETGDEFYVRHLLGPRRDERGYHLVGYTREYLTRFVESHGFKFVENEDNPHFYPSICMKFSLIT